MTGWQVDSGGHEEPTGDAADHAGSGRTWTVWADEVLTGPLRVRSGPLSLYPVQGGWDGYTRERQRKTEAVAAADVENYVTLTGDMHCYVAAYQQDSYPGSVSGGEGVAQGERIGVEFVTPAITSLNVAEALHLTRGRRRRLTEPLLSWLVSAMNPHVEFFDSHHWGYSVVEFTPEDCTVVGYAVDETVNSADAERDLLVAYRVPRANTNSRRSPTSTARSDLTRPDAASGHLWPASGGRGCFEGQPLSTGETE